MMRHHIIVLCINLLHFYLGDVHRYDIALEQPIMYDQRWLLGGIDVAPSANTILLAGEDL